MQDSDDPTDSGFGHPQSTRRILADCLVYLICLVYIICACVASYLFFNRSDRLIKEAFSKAIASGKFQFAVNVGGGGGGGGAAIAPPSSTGGTSLPLTVAAKGNTNSNAVVDSFPNSGNNVEDSDPALMGGGGVGGGAPVPSTDALHPSNNLPSSSINPTLTATSSNVNRKFRMRDSYNTTTGVGGAATAGGPVGVGGVGVANQLPASLVSRPSPYMGSANTMAPLGSMGGVPSSYSSNAMLMMPPSSSVGLGGVGLVIGTPQQHQQQLLHQHSSPNRLLHHHHLNNPHHNHSHSLNGGGPSSSAAVVVGSATPINVSFNTAAVGGAGGGAAANVSNSDSTSAAALFASSKHPSQLQLIPTTINGEVINPIAAGPVGSAVSDAKSFVTVGRNTTNGNNNDSARPEDENRVGGGSSIPASLATPPLGPASNDGVGAAGSINDCGFAPLAVTDNGSMIGNNNSTNLINNTALTSSSSSAPYPTASAAGSPLPPLSPPPAHLSSSAGGVGVGTPQAEQRQIGNVSARLVRVGNTNLVGAHTPLLLGGGVGGGLGGGVRTGLHGGHQYHSSDDVTSGGGGGMAPPSYANRRPSDLGGGGAIGRRGAGDYGGTAGASGVRGSGAPSTGYYTPTSALVNASTPVSNPHSGDTNTDHNSGSNFFHSNNTVPYASSSAGNSAANHYYLHRSGGGASNNTNASFADSLNYVAGVSRDFRVSPKVITSDKILRFFLFLVVFLVSRSTSTLVSVMMGSRSIFSQAEDDVDSRVYQDLFFCFSTFLYYCLPIVLLNTFASILERVSGNSRFRRAVNIIFIIQFSLYWLIVVMLAIRAPRMDSSLEYLGVVISVGYVGLYLYAAYYFPRELMGYGSQLMDVSRRIKISALVFAVCMALRVIIILPSLQDIITDALTTPGIIAIYMPLDLIPTAITMYTLHKRSDNNSGGGGNGGGSSTDDSDSDDEDGRGAKGSEGTNSGRLPSSGYYGGGNHHHNHQHHHVHGHHGHHHNHHNNHHHHHHHGRNYQQHTQMPTPNRRPM